MVLRQERNGDFVNVKKGSRALDSALKYKSMRVEDQMDSAVTTALACEREGEDGVDLERPSPAGM